MLTFPLAILALAIIEYLAHRLFMHHETVLAGTYDRHAVQHHRKGRVDINIDAPAWFYLAIGSPAILLLGWFSMWTDAAIFSLTVACYAWLWTGVHRATHGLGGKWATHLPFYRLLRDHHLEHHRRPGRNYGTVFGPLVDIPMGTWAGRTDSQT